jgi:hypothetical protein
MLTVSIVIYTALATEFLIRYITRRPIPGRNISQEVTSSDTIELGEARTSSSMSYLRGKQHQSTATTLKRVRIMGMALVFSTLVILIR